jgi:hypothetical protein
MLMLTLQVLEQGCERQHSDASSNQFYRQRQPVQTPANLGHLKSVLLGQHEIPVHGLSPLDKERYSGV